MDFLSLVLHQSSLRFDSGFGKSLGSTASFRTGIGHSIKNFFDPGFDQSLGAGPSTTLVVTGLQSHVYGGTLCGFSGMPESIYLCMRATGGVGVSPSDKIILVNNNATNVRVRSREPRSAHARL